MTICIAGEQDKHKLDFAARNIYTLPSDEFRVLPSSLKDGDYILEVTTIRLIEPIIKVLVSEDMLSARISFYPGINIDKQIKYQDVVLHLTVKNKINPVYINDTALKEAIDLLNEGYIVENVLICEGTSPVQGKDANIEYLFERPNIKPKLLPNGKVDYKEFTKFILVGKDQLIVKYTPPDKGKDGRDIFGNVIKAKEGVDKSVEVGEGVYSNLGKTEYRSKYNGHIILSGNIVSVLPMLQVNGDVDMHIGNVRFDGTIYVTGNVQSGFIIDSDDIIVEGIVEHADLKARNTIVIKTGIKGIGNKGSIKAGGNISVGYCENANISAGGELSIEKYCFNSDIEAAQISAVGKDSIISGGDLRVFSKLHVTNLGSKNSGKMEVSLGYSPLLQNKAEKVKVEINQLSESLEKINDVLSKINIQDPKIQSNPKVKMLLDNSDAFKRRLPLLEKKYNELMRKSVCDAPKVIVENIIYSGVELNMLNITRKIKSEMSHVEFTYNELSREIINRPIQNKEA
ncbi:MAG: FapA family protein [Mucispirillum sp.]|nr:FapA family protein [Mucispirillum sp.]